MVKDMPFEIGQEVMVPMRGLCEIVDVKVETILDQTIGFVHLKPRSGDSLVKMPVKQLQEQGVRSLVSEEEILAALEPAEEVEDLSELNFIDRIERWTHVLRDGDYGVRVQVLREMQLVEKKGELSKQERSLQKKTRLAARREIETVLQTSAAAAGRRLNLAI